MYDFNDNIVYSRTLPYGYIVFKIWLDKKCARVFMSSSTKAFKNT